MNGLGAGAWGIKGAGGGAMTGALLGTGGMTGLGGLAGATGLGSQMGTAGGLSEQHNVGGCLLYTSPSPRDQRGSRMPSSA